MGVAGSMGKKRGAARNNFAHRPPVVSLSFSRSRTASNLLLSLKSHSLLLPLLFLVLIIFTITYSSQYVQFLTILVPRGIARSALELDHHHLRRCPPVNGEASFRSQRRHEGERYTKVNYYSTYDSCQSTKANVQTQCPAGAHSRDQQRRQNTVADPNRPTTTGLDKKENCRRQGCS
jgi:hypothetical protein